MNNTSDLLERPSDAFLKKAKTWRLTCGASPLCPPRPSFLSIAKAWGGACVAIGSLALFTKLGDLPLILGSFGASSVLLFGFPEAPFSQPRNVIGGHVIASLIGLVFLALFGSTWWSMALAVATAIALMQITRTVHPPAGSNPVIVMLGAPAWSFLITPTLAGACLLVLFALVYNNIFKSRSYPKYWF